MPPKFKFTKQEIIKAAVEITRKNGADTLTARSLATRLDSSVKPIFSLFKNMGEVQAEVKKAAYVLYHSYLEKGISENKYPPYKASGMAYIQFAKEEKELFKLLYMCDRTGENIEENREEVRPQLQMIMKNLGLNEDEAYIFHLELWVFVHGIATMLASDYLDWDMDFISRTLTDAYNGLKFRYTEGKNVIN